MSDLPVVDPSFGTVIDNVPNARRGDLDLAVHRARAATQGWAKTMGRRDLVLQVIDRILANVEPLTAVLMSECGFVYSTAKAEITGACSHIARLVRLSPGGHETHEISIRYDPLGVYAVLAPWNAPVLLSYLPALAALYMGNTVIIKPSQYAPLTVLEIAGLARNILPTDVLQVLTGDDDLGRMMASHPGIDGMRVTGSIDTGIDVMRSAAINLKRLVLELGGNDAAIVIEHADVDKVAPMIAARALKKSGQSCVAIKRVYAHRSVYPQLVEALVAEFQRTIVGPAHVSTTTMGPVQNGLQHRRISRLVDRCRDNHTVACGGMTSGEFGYFVEPAIVLHAPESAGIVANEQFGPILPVQVFDDIEDAVTCANATEQQLGGSVWGPSDQAVIAAARLRCATAWVNDHGVLSHEIPFGGAGMSGIGCSSGVSGLRHLAQLRVLRLGRR